MRHMAVVAGACFVTLGAGPASAQVTVGGWAGFLFADNDRPTTRRTFEAHPFYLYVEAQPVEGYRIFGEIEAEHVFQFRAGERGAGELKLERLYLERSFSTAHNIRAGKFFLPFGLWYRLHWHFLTETFSRPFSFANASAPRFQVGLEYWGAVSTAPAELRYYAWVGDGPDQFGTDRRSVEDPGYGASLFAQRRIRGSLDRTIEVGVSYHGQKAALDATSGRTQSQRNVVAGVEVKLDRIHARSEVYWHLRTPGPRHTNWYANGTLWVAPRVGLNYRVDKGDDLARTAALADHEATAHSLGALWRPHAQVLLKAEYRLSRFRSSAVSDFDEWNAFAALKF